MMLRTTVLLALAIAASPSLSDEPKRDPALPGVDGSYSIVAPAPEPDDLPADPSATTRVGNWELTISGYVWVQAGTSSAGDAK